MKVTSDHKLINSTSEVLTITIEFNPTHAESERLAALLATMVDLVQKYDRLNTLEEIE